MRTRDQTELEKVADKICERLFGTIHPPSFVLISDSQ